MQFITYNKKSHKNKIYNYVTEYILSTTIYDQETKIMLFY